ncbi:helix-turn-helix transcriptional regulator [Brevibacterium jeotgali]|uniref:Predicted DNA-binding transcriptional regulator YafY, contains an HTH and WYL domains n=1 Tax=Brevibacterium jeotgali TaxID=1262550 RepID=A0A2H1L4C6_9MICO|nr:WYL domain-containing protein [Brevibacterium jeotgali]TWB98643.1 putative DNA-binding transcriptional regulator YafY [Brevibacterium jeotgali]SMY11756.1 Predicted DNA-binding transcriptional regulator YafY, contains an HTH and WYL domains [Brevibacterium jeotgali]
MRTSRMLAVLLELGNARPTTAQALAERHHVSTRTIQRDIAALQQIGVPVWTRTGPAGGVGLVDGWRSPVTGMTAVELQTLIIGEAGSRDLGLHDDFTAARLKMLSAASQLGPSPERTHERFLLDNEAWFAPSDRPAALAEVARSVWEGRRLSFDYAFRSHVEAAASGSAAAQSPLRRGRRSVDPLGLVLKTDRWYLVAARQGTLRTYRLSRMSHVEILTEQCARPAEFSLAEYWRESRGTLEASLASLPVRLSLPMASAEVLVAAVPGPGTRTAISEADCDGDRLEIRLHMESVDIASSQLMGVPGVEVLEPAELRREIHERAEALRVRNQPVESESTAV